MPVAIHSGGTGQPGPRTVPWVAAEPGRFDSDMVMPPSDLSLLAGA